MLTDKQKQILREIIQRNPMPDYMKSLADDDNYALSEIEKFRAIRLAEIAVDQSIIDEQLQIYS